METRRCFRGGVPRVHQQRPCTDQSGLLSPSPSLSSSAAHEAPDAEPAGLDAADRRPAGPAVPSPAALPPLERERRAEVKEAPPTWPSWSPPPSFLLLLAAGGRSGNPPGTLRDGTVKMEHGFWILFYFSFFSNFFFEIEYEDEMKKTLAAAGRRPLPFFFF